ncbi:MAG: hypothetical protein HQK54_17645, partial [Oligoflexales bacterium]|nr:hypothetical protein [Oligoflexales bacterium]
MTAKVVSWGSSNGKGGRGAFERLLHQVDLLKRSGMDVRVLTIDPLRTFWNSELEKDHFRSGCAPVEALHRAKSLICAKEADAVFIHGRDFLSSGYSPEERRNLMKIYDGISLIDAYTSLARRFIEIHGITESGFRELADALFKNYLYTWKMRGFEPVYHESWLCPVTPLFRGVDCANPVIDFEGGILVCHGKDLSDVKKVIGTSLTPLELSGVAVESLSTDGPGSLNQIAAYDHLKRVIEEAGRQACISIARELRQKRLLMEVYTCFPVVPLAFLLCSGLVADLKDAFSFLSSHPITVTGGMNLAKAPWNNPALHALVVICD